MGRTSPFVLKSLRRRRFSWWWGGVGANSRLREMLNIMCEERWANFFVPEKRFMGDEGSMIARTGLVMLKAGVMTPLAESRVRPGFRTDEVEVTWQ